MCLAAIPGFVLACAATAVAAVLARYHAPALVCGAAAIGTLMVLSRGLHLDGLADTLDGLGASYVKQRALEVMRTPDTGPLAVAGLVLVLLAQVACCAALLNDLPLLLLALMAGRVSLALSAASWWSPARSDGLGAPVVGAVPGVVAVLTSLGWAGLTEFVMVALGFSTFGPGIILLVAFVTTIVVNIWLSRTIGGLTGDTLGANIELTTLVALIVTTTYI